MQKFYSWKSCCFLLLLCLCVNTALAQRVITGKVTSTADSTGLPGVTITLQGAAGGAVTDAAGRFSVQVPAGVRALSFSYVGYRQQTFTIGEQSNVNIALEVASKGLNEVLVVGYGTQTRRDATGTISSIKGADIKNLPVSDAAQALQGRASGVDIVRSDGSPGTTPSIRIRGTGTINNAEPLVVIDGVPASGINDVNPNDIASMEILKDASSSAIYGTRAANGVIIITTKKGNYGEKLRASANVYRGVSNAIRTIPLLTAPDLVMLKKERYANSGGTIDPVWNDPYYATQRTNWQDAILGSGNVTNADVSIRGGNNSSNYMFSAGYYDEKGLVENTYFKRYSMRINSEHKLGKRLKIGENLQLSYKQNQGFDTYSSQTGLLFSALRFNPAIPVMNPDGSYGSSQASNELGDINNPVFTAQTTDTWNKNYRLLGNVYAEIEILQGLTLRGNYGFDGSIYNQYSFVPKVLDQTRTRDHAELWDRSESNKSELGEVFLTFNHLFAQKHRVTLTGGYSVQTSNGYFFRAESWGLNDEAPDQRVLDNGNDYHAINGNFNPQSALASGFVRGFYSFKDKYLLTATFRADGSSRFPEGKRWGYFPAFSLGWRVSDETFFKNSVSFISNLKITGGWGQLGNQNVADFQYLAPITRDRRYSFGENPYTGVWNSRLANPDITWEKAEMTNVSAEIGVLENKLNATITYFNKNTRDMLVSAPVLDEHGTAGIPDRNIGQLNNHGIEIELSYQGGNKDFSYNVAANASFIKNKVTQLYDKDSYISSTLYGRQGAEISRTYEGQPLASFYGWKTGGVYQNQAQIDADPNIAKDPRRGDIKPGDMIFLDINGDGIVDEDDRTFLGSPNPKLTYGIQAGANYKGFDLSLSFTGVAGVKLYNADRMQGMDPAYPYNMYAEALNRWHGEGTSNTVPRMTLSTDVANNNLRVSDRFVESGNYFTLRNVALGYTIPAKIWGNTGISDFRVYVAAQNLFIITNYTGLTPMLGYSGDGNNGTKDGNRQRGVDVAAYPQARSFTFGATLNF